VTYPETFHVNREPDRANSAIEFFAWMRASVRPVCGPGLKPRILPSRFGTAEAVPSAKPSRKPFC